MSPLPLQRQKRPREAEANHVSVERPSKRPRPLPSGLSLGQTFDPGVVSSISASQRSYIRHWAEEKDWPKAFFQQDAMSHLLARKKSTTLRRKRSESSIASSTTASDQKPREEKSAPYRNQTYTTLLGVQGHSYMSEYQLGIEKKSEELCQTLLDRKQPTPRDTIFRDDVFKTTCDKLYGKNEARIIKDLTPLIVPSVEPLATLGAKHLEHMVESVNEGWNSCIPVTRPRPQPDYAVGFARSAFTEDQLTKLQPFIGDPGDLSYFMATFYMHFPFLTCEVKCGNAGLDIADRQNAHSMTVAMKGVVELFRVVKREQELHRQILGFSCSHDHESVRIWGHYPVINKEKTTFWRYPIHKFDLTARKGLEKWTAYTFTKNVYDVWAIPHFELICSAIDDLPLEQDFAASQQPEQPFSEPSGLSQQFDDQTFSQEGGEQTTTPETSAQTAATKKVKRI